jgi:prolyl oligopeptidase
MLNSIGSPPATALRPVTEVIHDVSISDPYRWLEDQHDPETRSWLDTQNQYARKQLDHIPGRQQIASRVRSLLDVETYDSLQKRGDTYFFRKRAKGQEQPCICLRNGDSGQDEVIVDPAKHGRGPHTAIRLLSVSANGGLLLCECKQGGERDAEFEIVDVRTRETLPDSLPHGRLRGFAFECDGRSFYYVHRPSAAPSNYQLTVRHHRLGTSFQEDTELFALTGSDKADLYLVPGTVKLGILITRSHGTTSADFLLVSKNGTPGPRTVLENADYEFAPFLLPDGRILACTNLGAANRRIVEVTPQTSGAAHFSDIVPECELLIQKWTATRECIFVSYLREHKTEVLIFDVQGQRLGHLPIAGAETIRIIGASECGDEVFFERESFTSATRIDRCLARSQTVLPWARKLVPFEPDRLTCRSEWFSARDGTRVPMYIVGRREFVDGGPRPIIMTAYGGFGISQTPQFSIFVAALLERGCLFALPNIRGGSELGVQWHLAARRQKHQIAIDDFLAAAEWLIDSGRTTPQKLGIFGGSHAGLLVAAAMTQRPELFRVVVCIAPLLDMVRYHLFDNAKAWKNELGTAEDAGDFTALYAYSPYHKVVDGTCYPATLFVSGDRDQNCNPLHARKMTARLQGASASGRPVLLDYHPYRGHSPVLPLDDRVKSLTDRIAFVSEQLNLAV